VPEPRYGEVWVADLDPTRGHEQSGARPVLIISDDLFNTGRSGLVIAIPFTTREKRITYHFRVEPPEGGLTYTSFAKCEDIRSISKERLSQRQGAVTQETMDAVQYRIRRLLSL
jgi:mRNA interferase MazF